MESNYKIGDRRYFQPNLRLVDARTNSTNPEVATPCEIVAVTFTASKVYYDIEAIYVEMGSEYRLPIQRIPSDMIAEAEHAG